MIRNTTIFAASFLIGSALALAERPEQGRAVKPDSEVAAPDPAEVAATEAATARALAAIPLFRTKTGPMTLPFVDGEAHAAWVAQSLEHGAQPVGALRIRARGLSGPQSV